VAETVLSYFGFDRNCLWKQESNLSVQLLLV
jgi:hypothetical protein